MSHKKRILKANGQWVHYNPRNVQISLERAGAEHKLARSITNNITSKIKYEQTTTKDIHNWAFCMLKQQKQRPIAARFNLKKAIFDFGPTGFPFEQFIAEVLAHRGFKTHTDVTLQGRCITHEIDVIAQKSGRKIFIEAKFHHSRGINSDVKVPLYIHSRFQDIQKMQSQADQLISEQWVVTNTRFTKDAIKYALCSGLKILAWRFPKDNGLEKLIEEEGLHPITCLTTLTRQQKQQLLDLNIILCQDLFQKQEDMHQIGMTDQMIKKTIIEASRVSRQSYS